MIFDESIKFYGKYRAYQQRVLNNLNKFLDNDKIHVVAAPGSGKTTLGLELIKRLDQVSLVLVPSIAIREQWIDRFASSFLNNYEEKDKWISNDIQVFKPIMCITYQALYSAYQRQINEEVDDEEVVEKENYENFNLLDAIFKYNIKVLCLDECHHLKSEWWKVLESLVRKIENVKIIALTATPPYDSSNNEWNRYIDLCGPIDEEIFVPELIKDNNLCPHQDYIYYSYPTKEEEKDIFDFYSKAIKTYGQYRNDPQLIEILKGNKVINNRNLFKSLYLDNKEFYDCLISFLNENKVKIDFKVKLIATKRKFDIKTFEVLLQNIFFVDKNKIESEYLEQIKKELTHKRLIYKKKLSLYHDDRINKVLTMSLSKLDSIKTIVKHEFESIKESIRCLILTDYIKLKSKNDLCDDNKPIESFGTIPIFESLRREKIEPMNLCCLSGSICIVPSSCIEYLKEDFSFISLKDPNYVEVNITTSNKKKLVSTITSLFEKGYINTLVGTKSLLGEGWDSPSINTLILASFIGSYVLSNQMRGRAIRTNKNDLNKQSNIWHLVCLDPYDYMFSNDFYTLEKRFDTFVGIDNEKHTIENGIERLSFKHIPRNKYETKLANQTFLDSSLNRNEVKDTWNSCINKAKKIESLTKITMVNEKRMKKDYSFYHSLFSLFLCFFLQYLNFKIFQFFESAGFKQTTCMLICLGPQILILLLLLLYLYRFFSLINPMIKLLSIGSATLAALKKAKIITSKNVRIKTVHKRKAYVGLYLVNASTHEQYVFSDCLIEMLSYVDQPRYLLVKPKHFIQTEYLVVPSVFKKNKEMVNLFNRQFTIRVGLFYVIFAKNKIGKLVVLKANKEYAKYGTIELTTKNILLLNKN